MENITPQELENFWQKGKTLYAALYEFTAPEIRREYNDLELKRNNQNRNLLGNSGLPSFSANLSNLSETILLNSQIDIVRDKLKWDLLNKIISGKLIGLGYETPVKSSDKPQIIPLHIWPQKIKEINWEDFSFSKNGINFLNIRIIKKLPAKKPIPDKKITLPIIENKKTGRPSRKKEIISAYEDLKKSGRIDYSMPLKSHTELIQKNVQKLYPEIKDIKGMKHEAIRRYIGSRFQEDSASKASSKL